MVLNNTVLSSPLAAGRTGIAQFRRFAIVYSLALVCFMLAVVIQASNSIDEYPAEFLLCFIVGLLAIYGQVLALHREASIHFISFAFCFLFMSIAPIAQMGAYFDPIFRIESWAWWAGVNALAFTLIGLFFTYRMSSHDSRRPFRPPVAPSRLNYFCVFWLTATTALVAIFLFRGVLFTSRDEYGDAAEKIFGDQTISLLARTFLNSVPFFGALFGLRSALAEKNRLWILLFLLVLCAAAIINNPFIHPRYQLAGLAIFAVDYMFYGRRTKLLAIMLAVGVFLAPLLQGFRHAADADNVVSGRVGLFGETFLAMDYDAFAISGYTMMTVNNSGIAWGANLLGASFFFVPRSVWPTKPEPTPWIVYDAIDQFRGVGTYNLSTPLMAEGYFAFGWLGALLIGVLYWWGSTRIIISSRRDASFWPFLVRCVCVGLVLIFLRGPLTVGVSAVVGSFAAAVIPGFLINHRFGLARRSSSRAHP